MYSVNGAGFSLALYDKFKNGAPPKTVYDIPGTCHAGGLGDSSKEWSGPIPPRPKLSESFSAKVKLVYAVTVICKSLVTCRIFGNSF